MDRQGGLIKKFVQFLPELNIERRKPPCYDNNTMDAPYNRKGNQRLDAKKR